MRSRDSITLFGAVLCIVIAACQPTPEADTASAPAGAGDSVRGDTIGAVSGSSAPRPDVEPGVQVVAVYFTCEAPVPGQLYPVYRQVPEGADPVRVAVEYVLRGPTAEERSHGFRSLFSDRTAGMLRGIERSADGVTLRIDFADFRPALQENTIPASFGAGGVMADITWTVFQQFPDVQALRFAFEGDERAFWSWVAGEPSAPQVFTRRDWEQV
jgi:hypothetical protein